MQKGYKHSKETKEKMRLSALKRDNTKRIQSLPKKEEHWNWKEKPNKLTLHKRIHRQYGKASEKDCVDCGMQARDWSNETGEYTDNIDDYRPRCRKCHLRKDKNWERVDRSRHKIIRDSKGRIKTIIII